MKKFIIVTDSYGDHKYKITNETDTIIETDSVSLMDNYPLRFNKKENRMEQFNGEFWDVYISDEAIFQVDFED